MKQDSLTLFIILDAFRDDYIEHAPHLASIADWKGIVREPFGFISTRPAMCAGLYPEESGLCFEYVFRPDASLFKRPLFRVLNTATVILPESLVKLGASAWIRMTCKRPVVKSTAFLRNMPFGVFPLFDMAETYVQTDARYLGTHPTVYDLLRSSSQTFAYYGFARPKRGLEIFKRLYSALVSRDLQESDETMVNQFAADLLHARPPFAHLHFSVCDWVGHSHGPKSAEMRKAVQSVDRLIRRVHETALQAYGEVRIVASADHGMVEVKEHHDLDSVIGGLPFKTPADFVVWKDSTMARFWFFNERACHAVRDGLDEVSWGNTLTTEDRARLRIRFSDNTNGDLFFVLNAGHVLIPNYYQGAGAPPKGMHGYLPEVRDNQGLLVLHNPPSAVKVPEGTIVDMVDIFPTLLDVHGLDLPKGCGGRSLLGQ